MEAWARFCLEQAAGYPYPVVCINHAHASMYVQMTCTAVLVREALVRDFMRALYYLWQWIY